MFITSNEKLLRDLDQSIEEADLFQLIIETVDVARDIKPSKDENPAYHGIKKEVARMEAELDALRERRIAS